MSDPYASIGGGGKLKMKGVKDGKIDKKKKKKQKKAVEDVPSGDGEYAGEFKDHSVVLKTLQDEDEQMAKEDHRRMGVLDGKEVEPGSGANSEDETVRMKTEAERRHEEQRRKRLEDRLKKEGVKTHKQRVEELNRYLSGLSEHHDMPKIGPG